MPPPRSVEVHPIVLLSVVDHYNRLARDTRKRVVGILLGTVEKDGKVSATSAYAVPFDEDERDSSVWFLDCNYHETMLAMLQRVSVKERVVGWYSTGPKIKPNDLAIHRQIRKYVSQPVYVIIDSAPRELGIPCDAYYAVEEVESESSEPKLTFRHIPSEIGALEAEEIGVEHLLRDIKDTTISSLATQISEKVSSLKGLEAKLEEIRLYLRAVMTGKLPINHSILYLLQQVMNVLPGLNTPDFMRSMTIKTNDLMLVVYVMSLIRAVVALDELIQNRRGLKEKKETSSGTSSAAPTSSASSPPTNSTEESPEGDAKMKKETEKDGKSGKK